MTNEPKLVTLGMFWRSHGKWIICMEIDIRFLMIAVLYSFLTPVKHCCSLVDYPSRGLHTFILYILR